MLILATPENYKRILKQLDDYGCRWNSGHCVYDYKTNGIMNGYVILTYNEGMNYWNFGLAAGSNVQLLVPLFIHRSYNVIKDLHMRKEKLKRILNEV